MNMTKDEFLSVCGRLRSQLEVEKAAEVLMDTSQLWIAAIELLGGYLGENGAEWVDRWIFDTECGLYPDPLLDNSSTDEEFWEFLERQYCG